MTVPEQPKLYHITHVDRLPSIAADQCLWCDREVVRRAPPGTTIGMSSIKQRRLALPVSCHSGLYVGDCVPFNFCPRSVMLYLIHQGNHPELSYRGGQESIVHLVADLREVVAWADAYGRRWAFTPTNAGARHSVHYNNLDQLDKIDWDAVHATDWRRFKDGKQAEFLLELSFPWDLVERIGVLSRAAYNAAVNALLAHGHELRIEEQSKWYYD